MATDEGKPHDPVSYYHVPKKSPLIYKSIPEKFSENVLNHPGRNAVVVTFADRPKQTVSYFKLHQKATIFARHLRRLGVRMGDRVAVSVHNSIEWVISEFGVFFAGAVAVNLLPNSTEELSKTLTNVDCSAVVYDFRWRKKDDVNEYVNHLPTNVTIIGIGLRNGVLNFDDLLKLPCNSVELPSIIDPDSICLMWSTSGSTGKSKFVPHSHMTILNAWDTFMQGLGIRELDRIFQQLPMSYGLGFPMHLVTLGGTHVYANTNVVEENKMSEFIFKQLKSEGGTAAFFPSYFLSEMEKLSESGMDIPKLRTGLITGQRLDKQTTELFKKFGENFSYGYGLTDTLLCTATRHEEIEWENDPIGSRIFPGIEFKLVGDDGLPIALGQDGEICIRGPNCTKGYIRADGSELAALDSCGWFHTGDIGSLRQDGLLIVKGRQKDIIRRGEVNIFPVSVEGELMTQENVEEIVVVGVPSEEGDDELCAFVLPKPGCLFAEGEIRDYAQKVLNPDGNNMKANFVPSYFIQLDDLPRLPSGKPDRLALEKRAMSFLKRTRTKLLQR